MTAPVTTGAKIYWFSISTNGYGSAPISMISPSASGAQVDAAGNAYVLTDSQGNFGISSWNACPTPNSNMYILATDGSAGTGANNPYATLVAVIPTTCGISWSVDITETTTIAAAYALGAFATPATNSFATDSNSTGALQAAVAYSSSLINTANATMPSGSPWAATINTLGDILSACTESTGTDQCAALFSATIPSGGTPPTNTFQSALAIASNPNLYLDDLYYAMPFTFQPILLNTPNSWAMPGSTSQVTNISIIPSANNETVIVSGSGFGSSQGNGSLVVGGTQASITSWSDTQIVALVPNGTPNTGIVQVFTNGVGSNSLAFASSADDAPVIAGTPPGTPPLSLSQGPHLVSFTIDGMNFGSSQGTSFVGMGLSNGVGGYYLTRLTVVSWSDTSITVQIPSSTSYSGAQVVVVNVGGIYSNSSPFTLTDPFGCPPL